jgi:hypothetical protein
VEEERAATAPRAKFLKAVVAIIAIAMSLYLSERAVEKHINSIFLKLGLAHEHEVSKRVKATLLFLSEDDDRVHSGIGT